MDKRYASNLFCSDSSKQLTRRLKRKRRTGRWWWCWWWWSRFVCCLAKRNFSIGSSSVLLVWHLHYYTLPLLLVIAGLSLCLFLCVWPTIPWRLRAVGGSVHKLWVWTVVAGQLTCTPRPRTQKSHKFSYLSTCGFKFTTTTAHVSLFHNQQWGSWVRDIIKRILV